MYRKILGRFGIEDNAEVHDLMRVPQRDKKNETAHTEAFRRNAVHQADLVELPNDHGYKYVLCVVDIATRFCDAEPLKSKTAPSVLKAFETIYARPHVKMPKTMIQLDSGSEFRGVVARFFKEHNVTIKIGKVGRHRQQAVVESLNKIIGRVLHAKMNHIELTTGREDKRWVFMLSSIIRDINKHRDNKYKTKPKPWEPQPMIGDRKNKKMITILPVGQRVRIPLDQPKGVARGERLHGNFRAGDIRYEREPTEIERVSIRPNQPVMYITNKNKMVAYTKKQLQILPIKQRRRH